MRKLLKSEENLLQFCSRYSSLKELEQEAPHKYFILKRKNLLGVLFPVHTCQLPPNYVEPHRMDNYISNHLHNLDEILATVNKAHKAISEAQTTNEVDRLATKLKKALKELI